jgi:uncharacterized protein (DUF302 family)
MEDLITITSNFTFKETSGRVVSFIQSKGFKLFGRIDHAEEAKQSGFTLRPTELIIFGNPKVGTLLMQDKQTCGIDLPVKMLVWKDESGRTKLSYNRLTSLQKKHRLSANSKIIVETIEKIVKDLCLAAAG